MLLKYYFINSNEFEKDKQLSSPRWAYWVSKAFISVVGGPQNGTYSFLCEYTMRVRYPIPTATFFRHIFEKVLKDSSQLAHLLPFTLTGSNAGRAIS